LKIQTIRRVVIGGYGFRIAVDHNGLETLGRQRKSRVAAAIVELDALADTIGSTAENDDLARLGGSTFARGSCTNGVLVGTVHVRRERQEFSGTAVDAFEHGVDLGGDPCSAHLSFARSAQLGEP